MACALLGCLLIGPFLLGTVGWLALWWTCPKCLLLSWTKQTNWGCFSAFAKECSLLFKSQTYESPLNATERKEKAASVFVALHMTQPGRWWRGAYLGADFGLAVTVAAVVARAAAAAVAVVVVRAGISIFVHSIQEPEKEFQGVVLRVPSKLRAVLRHYTLKREQTLIRYLGKNFWSHYMVALWQIGATMITWCSWFVSENCFSWGHSLQS